jgi:N-acetylmuramoyl-L-alanine amidase
MRSSNVSGFDQQTRGATKRFMIPRSLCCVFLCLFLIPSSPGCGTAAGAGLSDAFFDAESCARELRKSPQKTRLRSNWTQCIDKFQTVYRQDPKGPWAPASLFHSGVLYMELSRISRGEADQKAAAELFDQLQKKFPDSGYRDRAAAELQKLNAAPLTAKEEPPAREVSRGTPVTAEREKPKRPAEAKAGAPSTAGAGSPLQKAEACYQKLRDSQPTESTRREWMLCIGRFHNAYLEDPAGPMAAQALYQEGVIYRDLHMGLKFDSDLRAARESFEKVVKEFPESPFAAKAAQGLKSMRPVRSAPPVLARRPAPPPVPPVPAEPAAAVPPEILAEPPRPAEGEEGLAVVQDLRHWSNPNYTRVVVYVDRETDFTHRLLKKDPTIEKPPRLYVDLSKSTLGGGKQKTIPINDDLLSDARAARYTLDSVRVVVDIKSFDTYKVFSLRDPFRIVIDVWGRNGGTSVALEREEEPAPAPPGGTVERSRRMPRGALARQLALGVRRIVIDPGHGGKDFGAPGFIPGVHEKDIVLEISKRVARKIREDLNLEAILTRSDDRYLTLEERTAFANTRGADLFVSIHTNASRDPRAYGTETYFLNLATDDESIRVAAMENATSTKNISDLHSILNDLLKNAKINESSRMAEVVQSSLVKNLNHRGYDRVKDKGVKQAPFYVLLGARMPSILVETAFISNREECRLLTTAGYQEHMAESIVQGLRAYIREINPTAFSEPAPGSSG